MSEPKDWWWNVDHSCQMGEVDKCRTKEEAEKWGIEDFTHVIEYSAYEQALARVKELEEALESIATGRVYRDGKPGKTPKTRARLVLKGKEGDGE